jgi:hypothetical protein
MLIVAVWALECCELRMGKSYESLFKIQEKGRADKVLSPGFCSWSLQCIISAFRDALCWML